MMRIPRYDGAGLVNLVAELERRLTGNAPSPGLETGRAAAVPAGHSFLLVLIDGLGHHQLGHPAAAAIAAAERAVLDAPFSTQTAVATATIATGLPPSRHGLIAYLLPMPGIGVVNMLWWFPIDGGPEPPAPEAFLPEPNLAERLGAAGRRTVVVEPSGYVGGPLDRILYRGARVIGAETDAQAIDLALDQVAEPGTLVALYLPHVDSAAHAFGQTSHDYATAVAEVASIWVELEARLPVGAVMVGTADHGHVDVATHVEFVPPEGVVVYGDSRVLYLRGSASAVAGFTETLPGRWVPHGDLGSVWGPGPVHASFADRAPAGLMLAPDHHAYRYPGNDTRLVGHHGGLTTAEVEIPLLVARR
jgi:hypothetical protein